MKKISEILSNDLVTKTVATGEDGAAFDVRIDHRQWEVIASNGGGWDHVSIVPLHHKRMPDWSVMSQLKDLCFYEDETAVEYHPKNSDYVNTHKQCLHIWRPQKEKMPVPPKEFV